MIQRWIYEGELDDPFNEFFVVINTEKSEDDNLWRNKYSLRGDMVPTYMPKALAKKIFLIGKSLNFIRHSCKDADIARVSPDIQSLVYGDIKRTENAVNAVYKASSHRLSVVLFGKYKLLEHLRAIKGFLLLGRGDFVEYLMDTLTAKLSQPATTIYRHNLTGILETAIRACSTQNEDPAILARLDVRLLEASSGDSGWDIFALEYHVDSPLTTILSPTTMQAYQKLFSFLWRVKRTEHMLTQAWRRQMNQRGKYLNLCNPMRTLMRQSCLFVSEMMQFVSQLQHYILFEGIESSWTLLQTFFSEHCECDLDELILAHNRYINRITVKALMVNGNQVEITRQLLKLFDVVGRFEGVQVGLFWFADIEVGVFLG